MDKLNVGYNTMKIPVPGSRSISILHSKLIARFGAEEFKWVGEPGDDVDAIGWHIRCQSRYLFSVSTHAGTLPMDVYNLQVSIIDDSIENGEIVLNENYSASAVCDVVARFKAGDAALQ